MGRIKCCLKNFFQDYKDKELMILCVLGFICLIHTCITMYFPSIESKQIDIAIRSQLITVFGYIFGSQETFNSNINSKNFQFIIASLLAFLCLFFLIIARWLNGMNSIEGIVIIRDLMVSATAFIIGKINGKS